MSLPEHIEKYLGRIEFGWKLPNDAAAIQVVKVLDQPHNGVTSYTTLGLSSTELWMPRQRGVRQELLFAAFKHFESEKIASFLLTFAEDVLSSGRALLRGDVIGPHKPLIPGITIDSVYCTVPVMFNVKLATYSASQPATIFVWVVPITRQEVVYIKSNGWNRFEELLEKSPIDFWDLRRDSIVMS